MSFPSPEDLPLSRDRTHASCTDIGRWSLHIDIKGVPGKKEFDPIFNFCSSTPLSLLISVHQHLSVYSPIFHFAPYVCNCHRETQNSQTQVHTRSLHSPIQAHTSASLHPSWSRLCPPYSTWNFLMSVIIFLSKNLDVETVRKLKIILND